MARTKLEEFSPDECLVVTNIAIPTVGESTYTGAPVNRNGVSVTIHLIAGPGSIVSTNGGSWQMEKNASGSTGHSSSTYSNFRTERWGSSSSFGLVEVSNVQSSDDIDFELRDESGNEIKLNNVGGYSGTPSGGRIYLQEFTPPKDAKALNLAVIVNRPLVFEFMVNPADVKTASKQSK